MRLISLILAGILLIYLVGIAESLVTKVTEKMEVIDEAVAYVRELKPKFDEIYEAIKKAGVEFEEIRGKAYSVDTRMERMDEKLDELVLLLTCQK